MSKYVRRMPEIRTCLICGKEFEGSTSQKYCSAECKAAGIKRQKHEHYLYTKALASGRTVEEVKAADEGREVPKRSLDKKLDELKASGKTYAQAQRAETIEKFARVEVPEAFQVITAETPEQPAGRGVMFFSKEEREALIRIEAQVETLKAFFEVAGASTGQDYPTVILGRILEQVKGLMSEADK